MTKRFCQYLAFFFALTMFIPNAYAAPAKNDQKEWTLMVFINGHNNLDKFGKQNINDMETVGSNKDLNILVQWASIKEKTVRRLKVEKDNSAEVTSPILQDLGRVDMGDYRQLSEFISWGVQNYPAKKYFIAVWNHGNGWNLMNAQGGTIKPQDISYDDLSGNKITTEELALVMDEAAAMIGHKVDVYASDACVMAMVEIAAQMEKSVSYFAGSQENEPGSGWPYGEFLKRLEKNPKANGAEISTYLTEEYHKAYTGGVFSRSEVTFSAFDLSKLGNVYQAMSDLSSQLKSLDQTGLGYLLEAVRESQRFNDRSDYRDLHDLVEMISKNPEIKVSPESLAAVQKAVSELVIINKTTKRYQRAKGVSIWGPASVYQFRPDQKRYNKLEFNKQTGWGDVLSAILQ